MRLFNKILQSIKTVYVLPRVYLRETFHLALPILTANLTFMGGLVIDTILLGHYAGHDLAAMSVGFGIFSVVSGLCTGLLRGLRQLMAYAYGLEDESLLLDTARHGIWLAMVTALLGLIVLMCCATHLAIFHLPAELMLMTQDYLMILAIGFPIQLLYRTFQGFANATKQAYRVARFNTVGLLLRGILSSLLIFGFAGLPSYGVRGSAMAVLISNTLLSILFIYLMPPIANRPTWKLLIPFFKPQPQMIFKMLHMGVPSAASTSADLFSSSATTTLIAGFGMIASAANQITANLNGVFYLVHTALSMACGILVSQSMGKNDAKGTQALVWLGLKVNLLLALCIMVGILLLRDNIVQFYTSDATIQAATIPLLVVMAFYHLFDAQSTIVGELLYCYRSTVLSSAIHIIVFLFW